MVQNVERLEPRLRLHFLPQGRFLDIVFSGLVAVLEKFVSMCGYIHVFISSVNSLNLPFFSSVETVKGSVWNLMTQGSRKTCLQE